MESYDINIVENSIIIKLIENETKCIYCGGDTKINSISKTKLNTKKFFYKQFNNEVIVMYKRRECKNCNRTFSINSSSKIKKYLIKK